MVVSWFLALAGGAFWVGVVLRGLRAPAASPAEGLAEVALGVAALALALRLRREATSRGRGAGRNGRGRHLGALVVAALAFVLFGSARMAIADARIRGSPVARLTGTTVDLVGSLGSDAEAGRLGWHATLGVARVRAGIAGREVIQPGGAAVWLEGYGAPPSLHEGDRVEVTGLLRGASGGFASFLRQHGLAASCSVADLRALGPPASPVWRTADAVRGTLRRSVEAVFGPREAGLLLGLALGDTSRLDPIIEDQFRATGLSHLTAVSGENVAMFLAPILGILTWLRAGRRTRFVVGLGAVAFFVALTRAEPSVLRAVAMTGFAMLGVFLGRPRSPAAILGAAILVLLLAQPWLVYAIGFQLSVAATAGMAALAEPLEHRLSFLPNALRLATATSLGAQAGVTPLLLYHFGVVPGITIPANLLAFPAVGPGMVLGLLAAALGVISRGLGLAVASLARIPLGYLIDLAARLARAPLPSLTSRTGALPSLVLGLAALAAAASWLRSRVEVPRRTMVAAGVALAVFVGSAAIRAGPPRWLTVTFFSVGWGDSELLRSPGGATILLDGGPDAQLVATDLARLGIRHLDAIVATHPHADHVTGLPAVLARVPTSVVLDPGCPAPSPFYDAFLRSVARAGVPMRHPRPGAVLRVDDLRIDVLAPSRCFHGTASDLNNDSLVLRVSSGPAVVLFGGDAQQESQGEMLRSPGMLQAPLVKWFHHGGNTNDPRIYRAVHATIAVICTGPNLYHDPSPAVLRALGAAGIHVLRTDVDGDVTVEVRPDGLHVESGGG